MHESCSSEFTLKVTFPYLICSDSYGRRGTCISGWDDCPVNRCVQNVQCFRPLVSYVCEELQTPILYIKYSYVTLRKQTRLFVKARFVDIYYSTLHSIVGIIFNSRPYYINN
jgi:hypothetical protein